MSISEAEREAFGKAVDARHWGTAPTVPVATIPPHQAKPEPAPFALTVRTPAELAALSPDNPEFLAPYIVKGALTELTGYAKKGKTSLLAYLVGCVVHGVECLDRPTIRTGALWLTEERPSTFRATLSRAGLLDAPGLRISCRWDVPASMTWPAIVQAAVEQCKATASGLLIIDTLPAWAGLTGDKENNAGDALEALEPLQRAAAEGLAVVIVRHDRKGGGEVGTSGRGSSAFAGAMDTLLALKQPEGQGHPNQRVLTAISRFDGVPLSLVVEREEPNANAPQSVGLRFNKHFYRALGVPGALATQAVARAIVETANDWMTTKQLVAALPTFGKGTVENLLRDLHPDQLDRLGTGKKNNPFHYKRRVEEVDEIAYSTSISKVGEHKHFAEGVSDGLI